MGPWLGDQDSNLGEMIQSHLCYRYIIPQERSCIIDAERRQHKPGPVLASRQTRRRTAGVISSERPFLGFLFPPVTSPLPGPTHGYGRRQHTRNWLKTAN